MIEKCVERYVDIDKAFAIKLNPPTQTVVDYHKKKRRGICCHWKCKRKTDGHSLCNYHKRLSNEYNTTYRIKKRRKEK